MEDLKQAIIGFDWNGEKKGRVIKRLTLETVARLSGLPPGVVKAALDDTLASSEAPNVGEAPCLLSLSTNSKGDTSKVDSLQALAQIIQA